MRRSMIAMAMGVVLTGCPGQTPPSSMDASDSAATAEPATSSATDDPSDTDSPTSESGEVEPWLEVGWGISEFNEFDGVLPIVVGSQGLSMFSIPLRGSGFYNPPNPGFDNPDMPMVQAWIDVPGYSITPTGHFNEIIDYPALFYPTLDEPGVVEGPAIWLVIPDQVEPEEIVGLDASLHVEMLDANGVALSQDHDLVIGEVPEEPPGP